MKILYENILWNFQVVFLRNKCIFYSLLSLVAILIDGYCLKQLYDNTAAFETKFIDDFKNQFKPMEWQFNKSQCVFEMNQVLHQIPESHTPTFVLPDGVLNKDTTIIRGFFGKRHRLVITLYSPEFQKEQTFELGLFKSFEICKNEHTQFYEYLKTYNRRQEDDKIIIKGFYKNPCHSTELCHLLTIPMPPELPFNVFYIAKSIGMGISFSLFGILIFIFLLIITEGNRLYGEEPLLEYKPLFEITETSRVDRMSPTTTNTSSPSPVSDTSTSDSEVIPLRLRFNRRALQDVSYPPMDSLQEEDQENGCFRRRGYQRELSMP